MFKGNDNILRHYPQQSLMDSVVQDLAKGLWIIIFLPY